MPLIDARCLTCGETNEVYRALADWPKTPPCPTCGKETEQVHLPRRTIWSVDPVVVFKDPQTGTYRFPGEADGSSARRYEKLGFERVEIRGAAEMRSFESKMHKREYAESQRRVERKQQLREERESRSRSMLRDAMSRMTPFGRAVAREAMRRNDSKPRERANDGGFHSEVFSNYKGNRDESRDSSGRRRRD